jgi:hypothetical protein
MTTIEDKRYCMQKPMGILINGLAMNKILTNTNRIVTAGCTPKNMFNIK